MTQESAATNATLARVGREMPSVRAMKDGTTASGFTIVTSAVNDRTATFHSGISGLLGYIDCDVVLRVDVPQQATAGAPRHLGNDAAVERDLIAIARLADLGRFAALVVDHRVDAVLANEAIDAPIHERSSLVDERDRHLA